MSSPSRSGVFQANPDRRVEAFTESVSFDHRLCKHDIAASIAHAGMLSKVGLITPDEATAIEHGLLEIQRQLENGDLPLRQELEDIHMHVEQALIERLGDVGRKLHTARSRNDQVSTDLRLWCRDAADRIDQQLAALQQAFVDRCEADDDVVLPAYTHLQRAQPVLAAHYWLAYCEKFQRDRERLADCRRRINICGLGAAALAGTSLPIDREDTAQRLGFDGVAANSIDISSDRDFVLELAFVLTMIAEHLSTWADEWVLWSTDEFHVLKLPAEFCTGSSIMPQKINPDVLELTRGKTARVIGNLQTLLVLVKGLPLAYNRDLQEDKEPLFDSVDTIEACLGLAEPIVRQAELDREAITSRIERGFLDATTLMEHCIRRGVPQRTAHHLVGKLVRVAMDQKCTLKDLPLSEFQQAASQLDERVYDVLGVENSVKAFQSYGSTAPEQVRQQVAKWKKRLSHN